MEVIHGVGGLYYNYPIINKCLLGVDVELKFNTTLPFMDFETLVVIPLPALALIIVLSM